MTSPTLGSKLGEEDLGPPGNASTVGGVVLTEAIARVRAYCDTFPISPDTHFIGNHATLKLSDFRAVLTAADTSEASDKVPGMKPHDL